jgi:hypothetical protein
MNMATPTKFNTTTTTTTAAWAKAGRRLVPNLWIVGASGLLGAVFGFVAFFAVLNADEAIGIIQVGRVPNFVGSNASAPGNLNASGTGNLIEDPNALIERLKSRDFARTIGEQLHDHGLDLVLPATQYGGKGGIRARLLRDGTQIEVRLQAGTDKKAIEILDVVFARLIEEHQKSTKTFLDMFGKLEEQLQEQVDRASQFQQLVDSQILARKITNENFTEFSFLMAARDQSSRNLQASYAQLSQLKLWALPPLLQETRVITNPAIGQPILSTPWHTAMLGLIAGIAFGLALVMMWRVVSS